MKDKPLVSAALNHSAVGLLAVIICTRARTLPRLNLHIGDMAVVAHLEALACTNPTTCSLG